MIPESILRKYDARLSNLKKNEALFHEGDMATYFHLVKSGKIKMATYSRDGKEFVQGYFTEGQSFGEPPLFNRLPYPASAIAVVASEVWRCPHTAFLKLLKENFDIHLALTQVLSGRLVYKSIMLTELAIEEAEHRLTTLIEYFRKETNAKAEVYQVPFTRQQLADMTGLRVETVIRCIKAMEQGEKLRLTSDGKILWGNPRSYFNQNKKKGRAT
ncbi:MAG: Crp/Fnr family transcriptional regulator [Ignavibacteriae bacterium]|nr:Crp/Fnr family transcriptional regulator [Ignavibacteriota bacterium]